MPEKRKMTMQTNVGTFRAALPLVSRVVDRFDRARSMQGGTYSIPTENQIKVLCSSVCTEYNEPDLVDIVFETVRQAFDVLTGGAYELVVPDLSDIDPADLKPGAHITLTEEGAKALLEGDAERIPVDRQAARQAACQHEKWHILKGDPSMIVCANCGIVRPPTDAERRGYAGDVLKSLCEHVWDEDPDGRPNVRVCLRCGEEEISDG